MLHDGDEALAVSVALVFALVRFGFGFIEALGHPPKPKREADERPEWPLQLLYPVRCGDLREEIGQGLGADDSRDDCGQAGQGMVDDWVHGLRLGLGLGLRLRDVGHHKRVVAELKRAALRGEFVGHAADVNAAEAQVCQASGVLG